MSVPAFDNTWFWCYWFVRFHNESLLEAIQHHISSSSLEWRWSQKPRSIDLQPAKRSFTVQVCHMIVSWTAKFWTGQYTPAYTPSSQCVSQGCRYLFRNGEIVSRGRNAVFAHKSYRCPQQFAHCSRLDSCPMAIMSKIIRYLGQTSSTQASLDLAHAVSSIYPRFSSGHASKNHWSRVCSLKWW